jgi:pilus assembly protein CpaC
MRPTVADDDTIVLQVRGDVTDLDYTTAINLGGAEIPGERVRSVNTTVTMREGDTLVLGGLITNDRRKQTSKVPFLGDLPIIGKLFQSKRFENNETELAIFLTPSIRRMNGSQNLREIVQAAPGFPELPGLQEDNNAFGLSTIGQ